MEISDREFHRLVDYMHDNFGINLSSKRVLIQGRLGNMLRERGFTSYDQYLDAVMADTSGAVVTTILSNSQQTTPSLCASRSITPTLKR